jgi:DNA-binding GntR family transcriptional regulator
MNLQLNPHATDIMKTKKTKETLRLKAYRAIKEKIIYLDLKPAEKISEKEIAEELDVSRTPVREALLMLEHEKIVVCNDGIGFTVKRFSIQDIEEYYALRKAIEDLAMTLVVQKITAEEIELLKANIVECKEVIEKGNIKEIIRCESEFHELLYRATKSEILLDTISGLIDKFHWFRSLAFSKDGAAESALNHHELMIDLIEKKDIERLKATIHQHLDYARSGVDNLLRFLL